MLHDILLDLFACSQFVFANGTGTVMPMCTDTIVLRSLEPIPARNIATAVEQPVRLYFDAMNGPDSVRFQEIPVKISYEPGTTLLYVVPEHRLRSVAMNGTAQRYELRWWCNYFRNDVEPTAMFRQGFVTAIWFNATAVARHMTSGSLLADDCVFPNRSQDPVRYVNARDVVIGARTCVDSLVFDHWSCSHTGFLSDSMREELNVHADCWPADTVVFTAWYRTARNGTVYVQEAEHGTVAVIDAAHGRTGSYGTYELRQDRTQQLVISAIADPGYRFAWWESSHRSLNRTTARVLPLQMPTDTTELFVRPVFTTSTSVDDMEISESAYVRIYDVMGRQWWQGPLSNLKELTSSIARLLPFRGPCIAIVERGGSTTTSTLFLSP